MITEAITKESKGAILFLNEEGILQISFKSPIVTIDDMVEITEWRNSIPQFNKCLPVLIDISSITLASLKVLKYGQHKANPKFTKKLGLVVNSPTSRIIGNLFLNFYKPRFPIRLFSEKTEALTWLKQMDI